jgi:hypothetical protein
MFTAKKLLDLFSSESAIIHKFQHTCHVMDIESEYMGQKIITLVILLFSTRLLNITDITMLTLIGALF